MYIKNKIYVFFSAHEVTTKTTGTTTGIQTTTQPITTGATTTPVTTEQTTLQTSQPTTPTTTPYVCTERDLIEDGFITADKVKFPNNDIPDSEKGPLLQGSGSTLVDKNSVIIELNNINAEFDSVKVVADNAGTVNVRVSTSDNPNSFDVSPKVRVIIFQFLKFKNDQPVYIY